MEPLISIVTPTYEAKGQAIRFLTDLAHSLAQQTFTRYEWIISDHSQDDVIKDWVQTQHFCPIIYIRNTEGRGNASINMNVGIQAANTSRIKIMHMDDMFCHADALQLVHNAFEAGAKWGALPFNHLNDPTGAIDRLIIPTVITNPFQKAQGMEAVPFKPWVLAGCPSVTFFVRDNNFYDPEIYFVNDFDLHQRLFVKYGPPIIPTTSPCVTIRNHPNQVTNQVPLRERQEWLYYFKKHNLTETRFERIRYRMAVDFNAQIQRWNAQKVPYLFRPVLFLAKLPTYLFKRFL